MTIALELVNAIARLPNTIHSFVVDNYLNVKSKTIIFAFIFSNLVSLGQVSFQKLYGGYSIALQGIETQNENFVVNGIIRNYIRTDTIIDCDPWDTIPNDTCFSNIYRENVYYFMTDKFGDTLWSREIGDTANVELGVRVIENSSGFLLVSSKNYNSTLLNQIDALGNTIWQKNYSVPPPRDARPFINGYILTGGYQNPYTHKADIYLFKVDLTGDSSWFKLYGDSSKYEEPWEVTVTSNNNFVVVGNGDDDTLNNFGNIRLLETDSSGNLIWYKTIGDTALEGARSMDLTSDGGFILLGERAFHPSLRRDFYLIKTNGIGDTLWTKTYGFPNASERGYCIRETFDHGFILTGDFDSLGEIPLIKLDSVGTVEWQTGFNFNSYNITNGNYVEQTSDSGFLIVGTAEPTVILPRIFLIKTDAYGIVTSITGGKIPSAIELFPNPFINYTTLRYSNSKHEEHFLVLYNLQGQLIRTISSFGSEIKVENLSSGLYFYQLISKKGNAVCGKFIAE